MTDLTPKFRQYIAILDAGSKSSDSIAKNAQGTSNKLKEFELKDSFIKECYNLLNFIKELLKILASVEVEYSNENDLNMSEMEKDDFDTEFRLQFQQYIQKFKNLEKYERERQKLIESQIINSKSNILDKFTRNDDNRNVLVEFHTTNNKFRTGILQSLNLAISSVSSRFTTMQQNRLAIQKKFELFDLNAEIRPSTPMSQSVEPLKLNIDDRQSPSPSSEHIEEPLSITVSHAPVETVQQEVKQYEETISKLTQEQIQLLQIEHEELLNEKNAQLKTVEKINKTILDIVSIQSELSTHLQSQSQNINTMLDNQDSIEINIQKGNQQLKKAKKTASRTAKMTKYLAIIIGILILFLDYIS